MPGGEPEGVAELGPQRPEPVTAPHVRPDDIGDLPGRPGLDPAHEEAGPVAEDVVEALLAHEDGGGRGAEVLDGQGDRGGSSTATLAGVGVLVTRSVRV